MAELPPKRSGFSSSAPLAAVAGGYLLFRWALAFVRLPLHTPPLGLLLAAGVVAVLSLGLPIAAYTLIVRAGQPRWAAGLALAGAAAWIAVFLAAGYRLLPPPAFRFAVPVMDMGMWLAVGSLGALLGGRIKELNLLLPAGVFAAFADFVVVNYGTVHHALTTTKGQQVLQTVSAKVPSVHPGIPLLTVGPADFLFLGIYLACVHRFGLGLRRNAFWFTAVLSLSLVFVAFGNLPVPALAPMSLTLLLVNWRKFRLTRDEWISMGVVLALVGALFVGYFLYVYPRHR